MAMKQAVWSAWLLFFAAATPHAAAVSVTSPDGRIAFELRLNDRSEPVYTVSLADEVVISESRLGLRIDGLPPLDSGLVLIDTTTTMKDHTWELPWGEQRLVRDHHNELLARFSVSGKSGQTLGVRVRVFNDGAGFRYEVSGPSTGSTLSIVEEMTEFHLPQGSEAWWIPARRSQRYELLYRHTRVEAVASAHTPFTVRTPRGTYVSLHEAALIDYAAYTLEQRREGVFKTQLAPSSQGFAVSVPSPFKTPWRTLQISERATGLIESNLILNLNEPNVLGDVSWVKPGKYVGIWWSIHRGLKTWRSGPRHGATTANTRQHIDFAQRHGFDGVLVEGWNLGWDGGGWFADGDLFSFTQPHPDFDLRGLADYARSRDVRLIGYHETAGALTNYEQQMGDAFALYRELGVRQVKTGYVADAGEIERIDGRGVLRHEWHDGQFMVDHYRRNIEQAAQHQISIFTHEPVKDTGLRRTYPNWLASEGARGQEWNAWGTPPNPPHHVPTLAFTRLLAGPMDFTPGIFELQFARQEGVQKIQSTLARQLALYVVIYSPVQMAADLPENYEARPDAFQFIKDVATDWDRSIALAGEPGDFVALARKERGGGDWYIGAVTDEQKRELNLPLDFLEEGVSYTAEIYRDGPDAHFREQPYDIVIEQRVVSRGDSMALTLAPGGGAAVRLAPAGD